MDAVKQALDMLAARAEGARQAILIIGESKDRGSETKLSQLLPRFQRTPVTVYSLAYSAYLTAFTTKGSEYQPPTAGGDWISESIKEIIHASHPDTCKILTESTGGRLMKFETLSKLENDLIRLGTDVHSRYILSFQPEPTKLNSFHRLLVEIRDRPDLLVTARLGYWAVSE